MLDINLVCLNAVWWRGRVKFIFVVDFDLVEHNLLLGLLVLAFLVVLFSSLIGLFFVDLHFLSFFEQFWCVSFVISFLFIDWIIPVFNEVIKLPFLLILLYRSVSQLIVLILCWMQIHDFKQHLPDNLIVLLLVQILLILFQLQHLTLVVFNFIQHNLFFIFQQFGFFQVCGFDIQLAAWLLTRSSEFPALDENVFALQDLPLIARLLFFIAWPFVQEFNLLLLAACILTALHHVDFIVQHFAQSWRTFIHRLLWHVFGRLLWFELS